MKTWIIRAKRPKRDLYKEFRPTRVFSLQEYKRVREQPYSEWTLQALFGLYVECYETRYKRAWPYSSQASRAVVNDLRLLVVREAMDIAAIAVNAVFSHHKLRWITSAHHDMLADKDKYFKFIFPVVFDEKQLKERKGEQAEWERRRRERQSKVVQAKKFFGGE